MTYVDCHGFLWSFKIFISDKLEFHFMFQMRHNIKKTLSTKPHKSTGNIQYNIQIVKNVLFFQWFLSSLYFGCVHMVI